MMISLRSVDGAATRFAIQKKPQNQGHLRLREGAVNLDRRSATLRYKLDMAMFGLAFVFFALHGLCWRSQNVQSKP
jgi:hypothetical protein